jgi:hypothetical protein
VAEVAEHGSRLGAREARDEVRAVRLGGVQLALEARVGQVRAQPLLAFALVPGRVHGLEADEPRQDRGGLLLQLVGRGHPQGS